MLTTTDTVSVPGELRLFCEAKLGETIQEEQKAGRLASKDTGRPKKSDKNVILFKDIELNEADSHRAQLVFNHQDLISKVVAEARERKDLPNSRTPKRECLRCERKQKWLPGYGGSEWGCWLNIR